MAALHLLHLRVRLATLSRAAQEQPRDARGRFQAGSSIHHDQLAAAEAAHPQRTDGTPIGGHGYAAHREAEHLRTSLGKVAAKSAELHGQGHHAQAEQLRSVITWRGAQGVNAIKDRLSVLERTAITSADHLDAHSIAELQHLYRLYQERVGRRGLATPTRTRLEIESRRIKSYLGRRSITATPTQPSGMLSKADRADLAAVVDAAITPDATTPRLAGLLVVRNYEYVDSHGNEHAVAQDSKGHWISNEVVGHVLTVAQPTKPTAAGKAKVASGGRKPAGAKAGKSIRTPATVARDLPITQISPNPDQPRKFFDPLALQELATSIKENGLLQPITVRPHNGGYQIVAGERRWRASQLNGAQTVPAIVKTLTDQQVRELSLIENLSRADMTNGETARAFQGLLDGGMTIKQLSEKTGKSDSAIRDHLALLSIEPHLQKLVDTGRLRFGLVTPLSRLSPKGREDAASRILTQDLGVQSAKRLIQTIYDKEHQMEMFPSSPHLSATAKAARSTYQDAVAKLTDALSTLNDETVTALIPTLDSPYQETQRLDLMIKQLSRMRNAIDYQRYNQDTVAPPQQRLFTISARLQAMIA